MVWKSLQAQKLTKPTTIVFETHDSPRAEEIWQNYVRLAVTKAEKLKSSPQLSYIAVNALNLEI